jgi:hypothetical protein
MRGVERKLASKKLTLLGTPIVGTCICVVNHRPEHVAVTGRRLRGHRHFANAVNVVISTDPAAS